MPGPLEDIDVRALVDGASARALAGAKRPGGGSGLWQWAAVDVGGGDGAARSGTPAVVSVGERDIDGMPHRVSPSHLPMPDYPPR
jgi:hypothetical protein